MNETVHTKYLIHCLSHYECQINVIIFIAKVGKIIIHYPTNNYINNDCFEMSSVIYLFDGFRF